MNNTNDVKQLKVDEQDIDHGTKLDKAVGSGAQFVGIAMILVGVAFLVMQLTGGRSLLGGSWWMIWMLIPVAGVLSAAYSLYQRNGRELNGRVLTLLMWGLFPFVMMFVTMVLGVSWAAVWPVSLVMVGVSMMLNRHTLS